MSEYQEKFRLIMISAMYENGGNTLHRLFDGHPQLFTYPFESQLGKHPVIGEVRGRGLLIGIEFVADRATRAPLPESAGFTARVVKGMRVSSVLVAAGIMQDETGHHGDHIQISPPFIIGKGEIQAIVQALDATLEALCASRPT